MATAPAKVTAWDEHGNPITSPNQAASPTAWDEHGNAIAQAQGGGMAISPTSRAVADVGNALSNVGSPLVTKGQEFSNQGDVARLRGTNPQSLAPDLSGALDRSTGYALQGAGAFANQMGATLASTPQMVRHPIDTIEQIPSFVKQTIADLATADTWRNPQLLGKALANALMVERLGEGVVDRVTKAPHTIQTVAELGKQAREQGLMAALKINADTRAHGYMTDMQGQLIKLEGAARADALQHMAQARIMDKLDMVQKGGQGAIDKGNVEAVLNQGFDKIGEKGGRLSVAAQSEMLKFKQGMSLQDAMDLRSNLGNLMGKAKGSPDSVPIKMAYDALTDAIGQRSEDLGQKSAFNKYNESFSKLYDNKEKWLDPLLDARDPYSFRDVLAGKQWGAIQRAIGEGAKKYDFNLDKFANSKEGLVRDAKYADPRSEGGYLGVFKALASHPIIGTAAYAGAGAAGLPWVLRFIATGFSSKAAESMEQARLGAPKAPGEWGPTAEKTPPPYTSGKPGGEGGIAAKGLMTEPPKSNPEWEAQERAHLSTKTKDVLRNPKATAEEKAIARQRLKESEQ